VWYVILSLLKDQGLENSFRIFFINYSEGHLCNAFLVIAWPLVRKNFLHTFVLPQGALLWLFFLLEYFEVFVKDAV
jgi:hypothetical protein